MNTHQKHLHEQVISKISFFTLCNVKLDEEMGKLKQMESPIEGDKWVTGLLARFQNGNPMNILPPSIKMFQWRQVPLLCQLL